MAVWNIKQTIMKDYDIQSCQWMACDRFRQLGLLENKQGQTRGEAQNSGILSERTF